MNAQDILINGHKHVLDAVDGLPELDWTTPGVCGIWSVKDIIAHLASFEHVLVDVLRSLLVADSPTPTLDRFRRNSGRFNDAEVEARQGKSAAEVLAEYEQTHALAAQLLARIPREGRILSGALPWYGDTYDLDDFIVYTFYGHKREHCAQIAVFRDQRVRELIA